MSKQFAQVRRGRDVMSQQDLATHDHNIQHRSITPVTHRGRDVFKDAAD
jgi:hypothetical protein